MKDLLPVIFKVLTNPKVLIAAVVCILMMDFTCYVVRYRKKPPKPKAKKSSPAPAPAPAQDGGSEDGDDGSDE